MLAPSFGYDFVTLKANSLTEYFVKMSPFKHFMKK